MCQGLSCCTCIWFNVCGAFPGCGLGLLCLGCFMCQDTEMKVLRGDSCCEVGCNQGLGMNYYCIGHMYFTPDWLKKYSIRKSIGELRGKMGDVVIVNQSDIGQQNKLIINNYQGTPPDLTSRSNQPMMN